MSDWRVAVLRCCTAFVAGLLACPFWPGGAGGQTTEKPDLTRQPTLYVVGYAHLDTEWRWEYPQVINEYIRKTMEDNFKLLDKYPQFWPGEACAQTTEKPNLTRQPTLYVVGYAHLDTEWRWEYPQVINEYIRKTMEDIPTAIPY